MIQDFQDHSSVPVDGESLSEAMHSRYDNPNIRFYQILLNILLEYLIKGLHVVMPHFSKTYKYFNFLYDDSFMLEAFI